VYTEGLTILGLCTAIIRMLRKLFIVYITPRIWKLFPNRIPRALQEFSIIEKDSGCQLLWALEHIEDPTSRAHIYQHVLEEFFHSEIFEDLSSSYSKDYLARQLPPREILISKKSSRYEINSFFAFAHVGEDDVNREFSYYINTPIDKKINAVFSRVAQDEKNHIYGTDDILRDLTKDTKYLYEFLVLKSKWKRRVNEIKNATVFVGEHLLNFTLSAIYYTLGFFAARTIKKRFHKIDDVVMLEMLKQQEADV
jgi:hypothetical protein